MLVRDPYRQRAAPRILLPVYPLRSLFGQIAKIDPIVKLVSMIEEPSNGSKVTVYLPSSSRIVTYDLSSDRPE